MAEHSNIEWTDATWNPITGCSIVSPGCANCYAMKLAGTRLRNHPSRKGLTKDSKAGPVWTGEVRLNEEWLAQPLRWRRPRNIFVCAHGDLFHPAVPRSWIDRVWATMALAHWHTYQVLTKRSAEMRDYLIDPLQHNRMELAAESIRPSVGTPFSPKHVLPRVLPNVWLGVSAERQQEYDQRKKHLRDTPAALRFFSFEPLLGPIDADWLGDWAICGGESGDGARPMHPAWPRAIERRCRAKCVPFFFKQWGAHSPAELLHNSGDPDTPWRREPNGSTTWAFDELLKPKDEWAPVTYRRVGKAKAGRLLDGVEHNGMPERSAA